MAFYDEKLKKEVEGKFINIGKHQAFSTYIFYPLIFKVLIKRVDIRFRDVFHLKNNHLNLQHP